MTSAVAEVIAWVSAMLVVGAVLIVEVARSVDTSVVQGLLVGIVTALLARGTTGVVQRAGAVDGPRPAKLD